MKCYGTPDKSRLPGIPESFYLNLFLTLANTSQADPIRAKLLPRTIRS